MMPAPAPTAEQVAILDAARGLDDLVIEAGAGTGKTTTLWMLTADRPRVRALYLAYNKAIAADAAGTFGRQVDCRTAHSVAFRAVGRRYAHRLGGSRMPAAEVARRLGVTAALDLGTGAAPVRPKHLGRLVMATVGRFCHSADPEITTSHVPAVPGYSAPVREYLAAAVANLAGYAWGDLTRIDGDLAFTHDHYLKLWQLTGPRLGAGLVLLDEAQDANPVIADVVDRQHQAQRIAVGDSCQALYGWRGAVDAMAGWDWPRRRLSESFRFGAGIAAEANAWLARLGAGLRLTGAGPYHSRIGPVLAPEAVLARTNAGAVAAALDALDTGHTVAIVGGVEAMVSLARASIELRAGRGTDHPELFAFPDWEHVREYAAEDPGGSDLRPFVRLIDTRGAHAVIALEQSLTAEEARAEVTVSTGHKAKGRQWLAVRIHDDFAPPADEEDPPGIPREDAMLAYVAVTRARADLDRGGLAWVDAPPWNTARCPAPPAPAPRPAPRAPADPHDWLLGASS